MEQFIVSVTAVTDGSRTVAEAVLTTAYPHSPLATGAGSSGREPGDKYDAQTGSELAIARALRSMAARLERRARGRVSHAESVKAHKAEIAERAAEIAARTPEAPTGAIGALFREYDKRVQIFNNPG